MTDDSLLPFDLPSVRRKRVSAAFDGGLISSDDSLVLLRPGTTPSGPEVRTLLKHLVRRIRSLLADARPARCHSPGRATRPCGVRNPERLRLLKIGARVVEKATRVRIHFASACPDAALVRLLAGRLAAAGP